MPSARFEPAIPKKRLAADPRFRLLGDWYLQLISTLLLETSFKNPTSSTRNSFRLSDQWKLPPTDWLFATAVTRVRPGRTKTCDSIPSREKIILPSPTCPTHLCGQSSPLFSGRRVLFLQEIKQTKREAVHSPKHMSYLRMHKAHLQSPPSNAFTACAVTQLSFFFMFQPPPPPHSKKKVFVL